MAVNSKIKDGNLDKLFEAILTLENVEECYAFFEDLCTVPELKAMSQRYVVATMLNDKRVYSDIVNETGASTATTVMSWCLRGSKTNERLWGRFGRKL